MCSALEAIPQDGELAGADPVWSAAVDAVFDQAARAARAHRAYGRKHHNT